MSIAAFTKPSISVSFEKNRELRDFAALALIGSSALLLLGCKVSADGASCSVNLSGASCSKAVTVNGTYQVIDPATDTFITFFDDGHYAFSRHGSGTDNCSDVAYTEFGTYSASASLSSSGSGNGTLTASALISSDASKSSECGFAGNASVTTNNGSNNASLTYTTNSSSNFPLSPVADQGSSSIIGSYHFDDGSSGTGTTIGSGANISSTHANLSILIFLDSTHYLAVNFDSHAPAGGGLEAGCYSAEGSQYSFTDDPGSCSVAGSQLSRPAYGNLGVDDTVSGTANITLNSNGDLTYAPSSGARSQDTATPIPAEVND